MGVKITKKLGDLIKMPDRVSKNFSRDIKNSIEDAILDEIVQGKSPVRGEYNFEEYSESYSKLKGRLKPVDMVLSGEMFSSFYVKQVKSVGSLEIGFKDEKAAYHQEGNENLPQRKLLPVDKGEKFNTRLTKFINNALKKAVKKAIK